MITLTQLRDNVANGVAVKIAGIGTSIMCGYRADGWESIVLSNVGLKAGMYLSDTNCTGFWQQLEAYLINKNAASSAPNYGGSGWHTQHHIDRGTMSDILSLNPKPDAVIIANMANDRNKDLHNYNAPDGVGFAAFQANIRTMVADCIAADVLPILMTEGYLPYQAGLVDLPDGWDAALGNLGSAHHAWTEFIDEYSLIATENSISVIGGSEVTKYSNDTAPTGHYASGDQEYDPRYSYSAVDRIHHNQIGHTLLFNAIKPFLETTTNNTPRNLLIMAVKNANGQYIQVPISKYNGATYITISLEGFTGMTYRSEIQVYKSKKLGRKSLVI
jgi:hypothetical protein